MGYDIYIANKDKSKVYKLPIIPAELPSIISTIANETFETYWNGTFSFIEKVGLKTLTLECWLPNKIYSFAKSNIMGKSVIDLFNNAVEQMEYIQVVIINTSDGSTYINDKFTIESGYQYNINKRGDYVYTLPLQQYRESTSKNYVFGWNQNPTGWWYCYDVQYYKWYANEWKFIEWEWYFFNEAGYALENQWLLWKNEWYYLDEKCMAVHGKWKKIDGKWYYFYDGTCKMASNCYTPDGYLVDGNGAWIK